MEKKSKRKGTKGFEANTAKQQASFRALKDKKQLKPFKSRISYDGK
jgi:hypothetical protein